MSIALSWNNLLQAKQDKTKKVDKKFQSLQKVQHCDMEEKICKSD